MSLILEALRKSEAERRRGQSPQLFDPPAAAPAVDPARSVPVAWWAIPVALSVAMLALWRYDATPEPAGGASRAEDGNAEAAAVVSPMPAAALHTPAPALPPGPVDPTDAPGRIEPAPAATPSVAPVPQPAIAPRSLAVDTRSAGREPTAIGDAPGPAAAPPVATRPAPASARPPVPPPVLNPSTPAAAIASRSTAATPGQPLSRPPAAPAAARPVSTGAPAPTTTAPAPAIVTPTHEPLRLADLTPAERRQLPPLKMSMHMWSADTTQRFVILDGARVGEGDRVGDAVVDEITSDGAVLAWGGRRVKVSVR